MTTKVIFYDHKNFEYFKLERESVEEFMSLRDSIKTLALRKKIIPVRKINRLFKLLKNVRSEQYFKYDLEKKLLVSNLIDFFIENENLYYKFFFVKQGIPTLTAWHKMLIDKDRKVNDEDLMKWYNGFDSMLMYVVSGIVEQKILNEEDWGLVFCLRAAFNLFKEYREDHMSLGQQNLYKKDSMLITLSGIITEKVFEFDLIKDAQRAKNQRKHKTELLKPKEYYDTVKYSILKAKKI